MENDLQHWKRLKQLHTLIHKCTSLSAFIRAGTPRSPDEELQAYTIYRHIAEAALEKDDYDLAHELYEDMYTVINQLSFFTFGLKCEFLEGLTDARNGKGTDQAEENIELLRRFIAEAEAAASKTR